eukprot:1161659-Pelagomonas_calceolata.AAC.2
MDAALLPEGKNAAHKDAGQRLKQAQCQHSCDNNCMCTVPGPRPTIQAQLPWRPHKLQLRRVDHSKAE